MPEGRAVCALTFAYPLGSRFLRASHSFAWSLQTGGRWPLLDSVSPVHMFYSPRFAVKLRSTYLGL